LRRSYPAYSITKEILNSHLGTGSNRPRYNGKFISRIKPLLIEKIEVREKIPKCLIDIRPVSKTKNIKKKRLKEKKEEMANEPLQKLYWTRTLKKKIV
jgi:hypothetical protein